MPQQGLLSSATLAIADVANFCGRQPEVCQTAGLVADRLEAKAKYNVKLIYEWAAEGSAPVGIPATVDQTAASDPMATGSTPATTARLTAGQSTLRLEDLIPSWRSPASKKNG